MASRKSYPYEEVIDFTNSGGTLDTDLTTLQESIKKLTTMIQECEELYHGESGQGIQKQYKKIYGQIGKDKSGMWGAVTNIADLNNFMHANAQYDKMSDELAAEGGQFNGGGGNARGQHVRGGILPY